MEISSASVDRIDDVLRLWAAADAEPTITDGVDALRVLLRENTSSLIVAIEDHAVVGSVIAAWDGWRGNLYRLAVLPERRRLGVAMALVAEAERRLVARGARRITLVVASDAAAMFWTAAGYTRQPDRTRFVRNLSSGGVPGRGLSG